MPNLMLAKEVTRYTVIRLRYRVAVILTTFPSIWILLITSYTQTAVLCLGSNDTASIGKCIYYTFYSEMMTIINSKHN